MRLFRSSIGFCLNRTHFNVPTTDNKRGGVTMLPSSVGLATHLSKGAVKIQRIWNCPIGKFLLFPPDLLLLHPER